MKEIPQAILDKLTPESAAVLAGYFAGATHEFHHPPPVAQDEFDQLKSELDMHRQAMVEIKTAVAEALGPDTKGDPLYVRFKELVAAAKRGNAPTTEPPFIWRYPKRGDKMVVTKELPAPAWSYAENLKAGDAVTMVSASCVSKPLPADHDGNIDTGSYYDKNMAFVAMCTSDKATDGVRYCVPLDHLAPA